MPEEAYIPFGLDEILQKQGDPSIPRDRIRQGEIRLNQMKMVERLQNARSNLLSSIPEYLRQIGTGYTNRYGGLGYNLMNADTNWGGGPGSLFINAHGLPGRRAFYYGTGEPEPGAEYRADVMGPISREIDQDRVDLYLSGWSSKKKQPINDAIEEIEKLLPRNIGLGGVNAEDLARSLGPKTNEINQIISTACYASGITPEQWRSMFPNLTNVVQSATNMVTTKGAVLNAFHNPFIDPGLTNLNYTPPPGVSPLYNYSIDPNTGIVVSTNEVKTPADWPHPKFE